MKPPYSRKLPTKSRGPFARCPAWIFRQDGGLLFRALRPTHIKVILWLCFKTDNKTDMTPKLSVSRLARASGLTRPTVYEALTVLEGHEIVSRQGGRFVLNFSSNNSLTTTASQTNDSDSLARLSSPDESLSNDFTHLSKHFTHGRKVVLQPPIEDDPAWVEEPEMSDAPQNYEPGADPELLQESCA